MKFFFLIFLGAAIAQSFAAELPASLKPEPHQRDPYNWQARHENVKKRNSEIKPDYVMIGDSIIHHWGGEPEYENGAVGKDSWDALFKGKTSANLGFGFDYIDNAYYRVEHGELDGISPRVIIVLMGTNNLGHRKDSPADCAANMKAFLELVAAKCPKSRILLLGILPRMEPELANPIKETNALYEKLAGKNIKSRIVFADPGKVLMDGASPHPKKIYMRDTVHPNADGYRMLSKQIAAALNKWDAAYRK